MSTKSFFSVAPPATKSSPIKTVYALFFAMLLLMHIAPAQAQSIEGREFWLTFGRNYPEGGHASPQILQIRIVAGSTNVPVAGTIHFTNLATSVTFDIPAGGIYTHQLSAEEMQASLNMNAGRSNNSIRINANQPVIVYAMNLMRGSSDATNILPVTTLGTSHYQISYMPYRESNIDYLDAYAIVATQNNTTISHNGTLIYTLNAGDVYYRTSENDMTGANITSNNPVAFFAVNQGPRIPTYFSDGLPDCLMQQLPPVNTWGRTFFVPVTVQQREIVRIVASEDNTMINQIGGSLPPPAPQTSLPGPGAPAPAVHTLNAGEFIDLVIYLSNNGLYINADKPVGVCSYLTVYEFNESVHASPIASDPSQCWVPSIEQTVTEALVAPFVVSGANSAVEIHNALIVTPTATKDDTRFSRGGSAPAPLTGGSWYDNTHAGMSFYHMPLDNNAYHFSNEAGLIIMGYGMGGLGGSVFESYYFLAFSAMRTLVAGFYANDIHYMDLEHYIFCDNEVFFSTDIDGRSPLPGSLRWFINGVEEIAARDIDEWDRIFAPGEYEIRVEVRQDDGEFATLVSTLYIGVPITATSSPAEAGIINGDGCIKYGEMVDLTLTPLGDYVFLNWTDENGEEVSTDASYSFPATVSRNLVANFEIITYEVILSTNPPGAGTLSGGGTEILAGSSVTVSIEPNPTYTFLGWTENNIAVSEFETFTFILTEDRNLVANFYRESFLVELEVNVENYGNASGSGIYQMGEQATVEALASDCYRFANWTDVNGTFLSSDNPYMFTVTQDVTLVANFYALDFDEYAPTLWDNTFMLNLSKLDYDGYDVIGCRWFKNDVEETNTRTINEFSYSAGPNSTDKLETTPTYYMFMLITRNFGNLCSTLKSINYIPPIVGGSVSSLLAYPNPLPSGSTLTLEEVDPNSMIHVYNMSGILVKSAVASDSPVTLTLPLEGGVYVIRNGEKTIKIIVTN